MSRSPVDALPTELLGKIFGYVIFAPGSYPVKLDRSRPHPYNVTLVSRHWRDVAYSTPQLWTVLPGHYPQLWEGIVKRSGILPLHVEWYGKPPQKPQAWPPEVLGDPDCHGRLWGLTLRPCIRGLKSSLGAIVPSSSLQYVHLAGGRDHIMWSDYMEFLTFIQNLPNMTHLGLEGGCIPLATSAGPAPTLRTRFDHPNLRSLDLKGWAQRVFGFLELVPLPALERLEFQANCVMAISEITHGDPQRVFQDFWGGWKVAPRSLAVVGSGKDLEVVLGQGETPGHEPGSGAGVPLLRLKATGFRETGREAWRALAEVLPLWDIEEMYLHNVRMRRHDAMRLLEWAPQTRYIVVTGPHAKVVVGAPRGMADDAQGLEILPELLQSLTSVRTTPFTN